jgi:citrate lyase subunit beta/citryl-CoA lyase
VSRSPLSLLYVPGDRPDRAAKAVASPADVVILDLEDAVAPDAKARAREAVLGVVLAAGARAIQVRVNAVGSPWHDADLAMVRGLDGAIGVRVPKCESTEAVRGVARAAGKRPLHLLLESALGIERAFELATAHDEVASVGLGEADLRADLGVTAESGLDWARSRVVNAAAAAGLQPPSMSVFTDVQDLEALADSCRRGRELGFRGRAAIHPAQVPVIREAFRPTDEELRRARQVLAGATEGLARGSGAVALPDGRFVDEAVVRWARRVVEDA